MNKISFENECQWQALKSGAILAKLMGHVSQKLAGNDIAVTEHGSIALLRYTSPAVY